jgi:LAO/AO transport system kinase
MKLVDKMLAGDVLSLARLISIVERDNAEMPAIMKLVYAHSGKAYCVGVTGPAGTGKSTIVDRLTAIIRQQGLTVGIICADPSSPFSGGAMLGDRIRMQQHYLDNGVFIRSMATRGSHGGLPHSTSNVIKLLNAFGKDFILVETVGVGQTELDIMQNTDTTVVVLTPESGDIIQTMKAGLFEIADIFVVNKTDRPGAESLIVELKSMLKLSSANNFWQVPVIAVQAINNVGIQELYQQIERHHKTLEDTGLLLERRKEQRRHEFMEAVQSRLQKELLKLVKKDKELSKYMAQVESAEIAPVSAADKVFKSGKLLDNWARQLAESHSRAQGQ